jgi:hypothetical protein
MVLPPKRIRESHLLHPAYFDYWSGHYFQRSSGWLRALAVGDYELRIGQGLIAWSGFGMSKSIYSHHHKAFGSDPCTL